MGLQFITVHTKPPRPWEEPLPAFTSEVMSRSLTGTNVVQLEEDMVVEDMGGGNFAVKLTPASRRKVELMAGLTFEERQRMWEALYPVGHPGEAGDGA